MIELFETLGMAEPSAITEINNGPQLARGDVASIDLRGIGSGSTLTLINGRRMAPHPISMAENGVPSLAVNINAVPRALISRVEILRDPGDGKTPEVNSPHLPWIHAMRQQAMNFVKVCRGEMVPPCTAAEAVEDLKAAREYILLRDGV